jgi:hypothetical protein
MRRKSKQHHVWQQYLRSWSEEGKVYCLQNDRVFRTGTPVLGVATDFYKVPALTNEDLKLIHFLLALDKAHPIARKHHEMVLQNILSPTLFVQQHRGELQHLTEIDDLLDVYNTNAVDDQHTAIESSFVPLLARTLNQDIAWYENAQHCISFCNCIAAQHMRTRNLKEKTIARLKDRMGLDISRVWDILVLIFGFNIGCALFLERKGRPLIIVRNDSGVSFITGDQPVINLYGDGESSPESLSFYYPVSPRLALYLGEPGESSDIPFHALTVDAVSALNLRMARASHSQTYAHSADSLALIRNQVRKDR